jgi:hypothetical protein
MKSMPRNGSIGRTVLLPAQIIEMLSVRKGELLDMLPAQASGPGPSYWCCQGVIRVCLMPAVLRVALHGLLWQGGRQRLSFHVPSRGLIGFKPLFVNATRGEGLLSRSFLEYQPHKGSFTHVRKGVYRRVYGMTGEGKRHEGY